MKFQNFTKALLILVLAGVLGIGALPAAQKEFVRAVPVVGDYLADQKINLGLDLQGGTHLDYRVQLADVPEKDHDAVVAGVREVLERRVNGLGVSEPNIFESTVGDERHIIVELAGIRDIEEAKAIVGKTIQLEFKEQQTEADPAEAAAIETKAKEFLAAALAAPADFEMTFEDFEDKPKIALEKDSDWVWLGDLGENLALVGNLEPGQVFGQLLKPDAGEYFVNAQGSVAQRSGFYVAQLLEKEEGAERTVEHEAKRKASHVLISFAGAERADAAITRTEEEAQSLAAEILVKAQAGEDFAELAKANSDDPSAATNNGDLGEFGRGQMVPAFEDAVFEKTEPGLVERVVRSSFGYHIIQVTGVTEVSTEKTNETRVKLAKAFFNTAPDGWQATGLTGQHFRRADVGSDPTTMRPIVNIYFTETAVAESNFNVWQLVWYLVALVALIAAVSYALGLFVSEGRRSEFRKDLLILALALFALAGSIYGIIQTTPQAAEVITPEIAATEEPAEISETDQTGVDLFAEITKRNIQKPVAIFLDGYSIIDTNRDGKIDETDPAYAPVVQSEITSGQAVISGLASYEEANALAKNLNTGAIPAPVKLVGQYTIGATLGEQALATSLNAGLIGLVLVAIFMLLYYRLPGLIAGVALLIYGALLIFALEALGVVLTLAGVAGVILSIGMAVDANILIFERLKEELQLGKTLHTAVEDGFDRAWTSIRDSNVSSLITCVILFWFGSSIIQGFALTLAVGILISMFTAITASRALLRITAGPGWLFGSIRK